jgi:hypothetical protein
MRRMGMIKGARRSAKQVVEKFVSTAILKIEVCGAGTDPIRDQLLIYRGDRSRARVDDIETKITRALDPKRGTGIFTES